MSTTTNSTDKTTTTAAPAPHTTGTAATTTSELMRFDPEMLTLVLDTKHWAYSKRAERPFNEARVRHIMKHGVLLPLLAAEEKGKLLVIAGRGRLIDAHEAKKRGWDGKLDVLVKTGSEAELREIAAGENNLRDDESPIERALQAKAMLDAGSNEDDTAASMGWTSRVQVKNQLRLLSLDPEVQKEVEAGTMSQSAALELAKLPPAEQKKAVAEVAAEATHEEKATGASRKKSAKQRKVSIKKARNVVRQKQGKAALDKPGKVLLRRLVESAYLAEPVRRTIAWVLGDAGAAKGIKGLAEAVKDAQAQGRKGQKKAAAEARAAKAKKPAKKAAAAKKPEAKKPEAKKVGKAGKGDVSKAVNKLRSGTQDW